MTSDEDGRVEVPTKSTRDSRGIPAGRVTCLDGILLVARRVASGSWEGCHANANDVTCGWRVDRVIRRPCVRCSSGRDVRTGPPGDCPRCLRPWRANDQRGMCRRCISVGGRVSRTLGVSVPRSAPAPIVGEERADHRRLCRHRCRHRWNRRREERRADRRRARRGSRQPLRGNAPALETRSVGEPSFTVLPLNAQVFVKLVTDGS